MTITPMSNNQVPFTLPFESLLQTVEGLNFTQLLQLRETVQTKISEQIPNFGKDDLSSDADIYYGWLQQYLMEGDWKAASYLTENLILEANENNNGYSINIREAEEFPMTDIETMDRLWVKYSKGRFGFSVQQRIWEEVDKDDDKFLTLIGWKGDSDKSSLASAAPIGHYPSVPPGYTETSETWGYEHFTDSEGMDQTVHSAESVDPIYVWKALLGL